MAKSSEDDGMIEHRAIQLFDAMKGVTNSQVTARRASAGGNLLTVKFQRDGMDRWGWYFEKGDVRRPLYNAEEVASFIEAQMTGGFLAQLMRSPSTSEFFKMVTMSILTFIFAIAVIYIVIFNPDNKSLQVLTGLLGLTIGYFVGKADDGKKQN